MTLKLEGTYSKSPKSINKEVTINGADFQALESSS